MAVFVERRRTIRIAVNGNLNVEPLVVGHLMRLLDFGLGGFSIRSPEPTPVDAVSSYRFTTPDGKWSAVLRARTVYSLEFPVEGKTMPQHLSGFTFLDVDSPAVQRQLLAAMDYATAFVSFS